MKTIRDALVIAWINGWIAATRGWIWVIGGSVSPVSFLVVLAIYGGAEGLKWGLVGGFIWTIASNGIGLIGDATYYRLGIKYQSMLAAAPVSPVGYALGLALSAFVFALPTFTRSSSETCSRFPTPSFPAVFNVSIYGVKKTVPLEESVLIFTEDIYLSCFAVLFLNKFKMWSSSYWI